jgi:hypothetical protein
MQFQDREPQNVMTVANSSNSILYYYAFSGRRLADALAHGRQATHDKPEHIDLRHQLDCRRNSDRFARRGQRSKA